MPQGMEPPATNEGTQALAVREIQRIGERKHEE
jgi:hypothetical protein